MKVLFFGNHDVGCTVLETLIEVSEIVGVVAHPYDKEDGIRYRFLYSFARKNRVPVIRGKPSDRAVSDFVSKIKFNVIWVTDYRYLLPLDIIHMSDYAINLHPSLLPKYRGRAPLNWALMNGEKEVGLTSHFIAQGTDDGDIIYQFSIPVMPNEDIGHVLTKLYPIYRKMTIKVIQALKLDQVPRNRQVEKDATQFPARKPEDGKIDWSKNDFEIVNLIRAVASPYPGAFSFLDQKKIYL